VTSTPYCFPDSTHQLWYDDTESMGAKVGWSLDEGLQGVGFWALTYDDGDQELWALMDSLTSPPPDDTDTPQDSGGPADSDTPGDSDPNATDDTDDHAPGIRGVDGRGCACATQGSGKTGLAGMLGLLALLTGIAQRRR
jgi:MYXO-CTERM domain-containing protein